MKITPLSIARMVDISAVQAPHGREEILELVGYAKEYRFIAVHVLPSWVAFLRKELDGEKDILTGAPVGFPSGGNTAAVKVEEARQLIKDGVQEMDMMINVGKLRSGETGYVLDEIKQVIGTANGIPVKVILEVHHLTDNQIKKGCELCIEAGAEFVKTSTGWAPTGATLEKIELITGFVGNSIKVKAAGGIRNLETLITMYKMGVQRFGINVKSSMEIIRECAARPDGFVEIGN